MKVFKRLLQRMTQTGAAGKSHSEARSYQPGDWVLVRGQALAQIRAAGSELELQCGEKVSRLPWADAEHALRPLASKEQALVWLSKIRESGPAQLPRPSGTRQILRASPEDQVEYARMAFRKLEPEGVPRDTLIAGAELLLEEIAHVLERSVDSIKKEARRGEESSTLPGMGAAPAAIEIEGAEHWHSFALREPGVFLVAADGQLSLEGGGMNKHPARPGWWQVYRLMTEDGELWLAIHQDSTQQWNSLHFAQVGSLNCENSRLSIVDELALKSAEIGPDELARLRAQTEGFGEYGAELSAGVNEYEGAHDEQERLIAMRVLY